MKCSFMLLLVTVAFGACHSFENNKFNAPLRSVTSEEIVFPDSILIGRTHLFCVADSFILLYDKYNNKNFTIINLKNNSVARICPLGQGPGELISPSPYVSALKKGGKTYLYFYDMALYKMFQFDADMVFIKNNIAGEELISIESGHFDQNGITYTDADIVNQLGNMHNKAIEGLHDIVDYNKISTAKNTALREGIEPDFECRVLDKVIELSEPLETGQTFYRGVSSVGKVSGSCEELNDAFIDRLINSETGDIISDKGYSYFSTNADTLEIYANNKGKKNARMIIQVPKGAKVKLGKNALKDGKEGIFPRNAQFKVIEKAKMVNGVPEIVLEYIVP